MANNTKTRGTADIVILLDVTDSMDYCIDAIKNNIELLVQELQSIDWRARIIGFRNYEHEPDNWIDADQSPFTKDPNELRRQIDSKVASGGDPDLDHLQESVLDALHYISQIGVSPTVDQPDPFKWRKTGWTSKCVLLFTDAGCQETIRYIDGNMDIEDVIKAMEENHMRLSIVAPRSRDGDRQEYKCYDTFATAQLGKGESAIYKDYGDHKSFPEVIKNNPFFKEIIKVFAKTVSETATRDFEEENQ